MTVARLDREMSSPELTRWKVWYELYDRAKAGKSLEDETARGDNT